MNTKEGLVKLNEMYEDRAWYEDVGLDQYGRYVVYVGFMNKETMTDIVSELDHKQVIVSFYVNKTVTREQFISNPTKTYVADSFILDDLEEEDKSIFHLQKELDNLEKICGSFTLQDIFYEIQDGKNAVTNMSLRYPEVRKGLERLYDQYGFDVIYDEIDG